MADRSFSRVQGLQKEIKIIEGTFPVGATGAVGTVLGLGVTSVTRNAAGNYTIKLDDAYNRVLGLNVWFSGTTFSAVYATQLDDATPHVEIKTSTGGTVTIQCYDASGSDTDPAQNSILNFVLLLRNSSVGQDGE